PRRADLLEIIERSDLVREPGSPEAVNVRELRRQYERVRRLPRRLAEETARVTTLAQQAWAEARDQDDYAPFAPWLARVVALKREEAAALGDGRDPYDALLEDYEPGLTARELTRLFAGLRGPLADLAARLAGS